MTNKNRKKKAKNKKQENPIQHAEKQENPIQHAEKQENPIQHAENDAYNSSTSSDLSSEIEKLMDHSKYEDALNLLKQMDYKENPSMWICQIGCLLEMADIDNEEWNMAAIDGKAVNSVLIDDAFNSANQFERKYTEIKIPLIVKRALGAGYLRQKKYEKSMEYYIMIRDAFLNRKVRSKSDKVHTLINKIQDVINQVKGSFCVLDQSIENLNLETCKKKKEKRILDQETCQNEEEEDLDQETYTKKEEEGDLDHPNKSCKYSMIPHVSLLMDTNYWNRHYRGSITVDNWTSSKSFISPSKNQIDNFDELLLLSSSNEYLLSIDFPVYQSELSMKLIACESSYLVDQFFELEHYKFLMERRGSKNEDCGKEQWWKFISQKFYNIFRDIVLGLLFLHSKDCSCGDLAFNVFVLDTERGRILPSLDKKKDANDDFKDLLTVMKTVILLPFSKRDKVDLNEFGLPRELHSFLSFLSTPFINVPVFYKIYHPYFWTWEDGVIFMRRLKAWLNVHNNRKSCEDCLNHNSTLNLWWLRLDGVFLKIYEKGNARESPSSEELHKQPKVEVYKRTIDIVRYVGAVYSHINENEYESIRKSHKFSEEDIQKNLIEIFPELYIDLHLFLCYILKDKFDAAGYFKYFGRLSPSTLSKVSSNLDSWIG